RQAAQSTRVDRNARARIGGDGADAGSPRSQNNPVMIIRPSRATAASMCSSGACCEHAGYECGTQIVGSERTSAKQSFGSEPPRFGRIAGRTPVVVAIESAAQRAAG